MIYQGKKDVKGGHRKKDGYFHKVYPSEKFKQYFDKNMVNK